MKQITWKVLAVIVAWLLVQGSVSAQSNVGGAAARVGLGVSISDVGELLPAGSDQTAAIVPSVLIPITIGDWFRVEPEVGGYRNTSTLTDVVGSTSGTQTRRFSLLHIGTGAFGVATKERFKFYYGGRIAYLRYKQSSQTGSFESFTYPSIPGWLVAPAVGGEYMLSDHFSLGGEVQVRFISWSAESVPRTAGGFSTSTIISGASISTYGALVVRFYFPL
ncbi:MAG: hypothetical protein DMF60_16795 [Acidobacteria bacterium]|nr:MAG: hypothetical protein DMF60_16795 [Acidobacteriota bacterium]